MKVKIFRCSSPIYWYENHVGHVVDVSSHDGDWFVMSDGISLIKKNDCVQQLDDALVTFVRCHLPSSADSHAQPQHNKYSREIKKGVFVDVYDVLRAFNVTDPCLQHLLKKALAGGQRGHKDLHEDLKDILASAERALEMHEEWEQRQ